MSGYLNFSDYIFLFSLKRLLTKRIFQKFKLVFNQLVFIHRFWQDILLLKFKYSKFKYKKRGKKIRTGLKRRIIRIKKKSLNRSLSFYGMFASLDMRISLSASFDFLEKLNFSLYTNFIKKPFCFAEFTYTKTFLMPTSKFFRWYDKTLFTNKFINYFFKFLNFNKKVSALNRIFLNINNNINFKIKKYTVVPTELFNNKKFIFYNNYWLNNNNQNQNFSDIVDFNLFKCYFLKPKFFNYPFKLLKKFYSNITTKFVFFKNINIKKILNKFKEKKIYFFKRKRKRKHFNFKKTNKLNYYCYKKKKKYLKNLNFLNILRKKKKYNKKKHLKKSKKIKNYYIFYKNNLSKRINKSIISKPASFTATDFYSLKIKHKKPKAKIQKKNKFYQKLLLLIKDNNKTFKKVLSSTNNKIILNNVVEVAAALKKTKNCFMKKGNVLNKKNKVSWKIKHKKTRLFKIKRAIFLKKLGNGRRRRWRGMRDYSIRYIQKLEYRLKKYLKIQYSRNIKKLYFKIRVINGFRLGLKRLARSCLLSINFFRKFKIRKKKKNLFWKNFNRAYNNRKKGRRYKKKTKKKTKKITNPVILALKKINRIKKKKLFKAPKKVISQNKQYEELKHKKWRKIWHFRKRKKTGIYFLNYHNFKIKKYCRIPFYFKNLRYLNHRLRRLIIKKRYKSFYWKKTNKLFTISKKIIKFSRSNVVTSNHCSFLNEGNKFNNIILFHSLKRKLGLKNLAFNNLYNNSRKKKKKRWKIKLPLKLIRFIRNFRVKKLKLWNFSFKKFDRKNIMIKKTRIKHYHFNNIFITKFFNKKGWLNFFFKNNTKQCNLNNKKKLKKKILKFYILIKQFIFKIFKSRFTFKINNLIFKNFRGVFTKNFIIIKKIHKLNNRKKNVLYLKTQIKKILYLQNLLFLNKPKNCFLENFILTKKVFVSNYNILHQIEYNFFYKNKKWAFFIWNFYFSFGKNFYNRYFHKFFKKINKLKLLIHNFINNFYFLNNVKINFFIVKKRFIPTPVAFLSFFFYKITGLRVKYQMRNTVKLLEKYLRYKYFSGFKFFLTGRYSRKDRATFYWKREGALPLTDRCSPVYYNFHFNSFRYGAVNVKIWILLKSLKKRIKKKSFDSLKKNVEF